MKKVLTIIGMFAMLVFVNGCVLTIRPVQPVYVDPDSVVVEPVIINGYYYHFPHHGWR
jgi:hypothetical protein